MKDLLVVGDEAVGATASGFERATGPIREITTPDPPPHTACAAVDFVVRDAVRARIGRAVALAEMTSAAAVAVRWGWSEFLAADRAAAARAGGLG